LDYAVSAQDPELGIEWPTPLGSEGGYVWSQKDLTSPKAGQELFDKIKHRIDDPIGDIHEETNSDVVVVLKGRESGEGIVEGLSGKRVHVLQADARNRESLSAAIYSLRPKDGVVYIVDGEGKGSNEITVELLNIVHICAKQKHRLAIVAERELQELQFALRLIAATQRKEEVVVVVAPRNQGGFVVQLFNGKSGGLYRFSDGAGTASPPAE
jgi:hypothetical protein